MWIINFIPDFIIHFAAIVGAIALLLITFFDHLIPLVYRMTVKLGAIGLLVVALFLEGANYNNNAWITRVKEMEAKVTQAEEQAKAANENINKTTEIKIKVIKEKGTVIKQYIDREIVKYDTGCIIPKEFIKAHNDAAEAPKK